MAGNVAQVTDANFDSEVIKSQTPVLVDFWAEWCGPCRMMIPVLDELAPSNQGKVKIVKLNVDESQDTPVKYGIMNIPTMILFKNGKELQRFIGAMSKVDLQKKLDQALS